MAPTLPGRRLPRRRARLAGRHRASRHPTAGRSRRRRKGLLRGKPEPDLFTPRMRTFLSTVSGRNIWQWIASTGAPGVPTCMETEAAPEGKVFRYRVPQGDVDGWFGVLVGPDGRVARATCW